MPVTGVFRTPSITGRAKPFNTIKAAAPNMRLCERAGIPERGLCEASPTAFSTSPARCSALALYTTQITQPRPQKPLDERWEVRRRSQAKRASGTRPGSRPRCGVEAWPGSRAFGASPQLGACTGGREVLYRSACVGLVQNAPKAKGRHEAALSHCVSPALNRV